MSNKKLLNQEINLKIFYLWFRIVSCILVSVGLIFSFFGFAFFPQTILPKSILLSWESAIYGSVLIGWGTTLFFLGCLAFHREDPELMKIMLWVLLYG